MQSPPEKHPSVTQASFNIIDIFTIIIISIFVISIFTI